MIAIFSGNSTQRFAHSPTSNVLLLVRHNKFPGVSDFVGGQNTRAGLPELLFPGGGKANNLPHSGWLGLS